MAVIDYSVPWYDVANNRRTCSYTVDTGWDGNRPIVLLLHGNGGDHRHMTNPSSSPGYNYDHGYNPPIFNDGIFAWNPGGAPYLPRTFEADPLKSVRSWKDAVLSAGFGAAYYSQIEPKGLLANPVRELEAVVRKIADDHKSRKIILLAHSRGGLLSRRFLQNIKGDTALRNRIVQLCTLHSPHQGSELANVGNAVGTAIDILCVGMIFSCPSAIPGLQFLKSQVVDTSYQELAVGSNFLKQLSSEEAATGPIVPTYTWGGTKSILLRPQSRYYLPISYAWQVFSVRPWKSGFNWQRGTIWWPQVANDLYNLTKLAPELQNYYGDLLTRDTRTNLPGQRAHRTNYLNHAEALWDGGLQSQVLGQLAGGVVAGDPGGSPMLADPAAGATAAEAPVESGPRSAESTPA